MAPLPPKVNSPKHWLWGPAYYAQREPLEWMPRWLKEYGDIFMITTPVAKATIIGSPEMARQVLVNRYPRYQKKSQSYYVLRILMGNGLVTSSGEFWRGQRKLVQPAFHRKRLERIFGMMVERIGQLVSTIGSAAGPREMFDFAPLLSHLTLDIISRAMFSSDVQGAATDVSKHIAALNEYALRMLRKPWLFLLPRYYPPPLDAIAARVHPQYGSLRALDKIVHGIIQVRRQQPGEHDDLLSMLLEACEESTGKGMSDEQLRDEVMTIFVAGHETTANAMAWLMYLLATHPEVEQQLVNEINANWNEGGLNYESLAKFSYTRQVIEESLRVYPTIWSIGRRCVEEDELGGYRIPVGMNVVVPIFHFHWNERFWTEPGKFDPDRFSAERRPEADSLSYFPFGAGPRSCIGNHFAMQELMLMTILFYRHFTFRVAPGFVVEPDPLITLRPKNGMKMIVERRQLNIWEGALVGI